jgi:hypothetical protein
MRNSADRLTPIEERLRSGGIVPRLCALAFAEMRRSEAAAAPAAIQVSYYTRLLPPMQAPEDLQGNQEALRELRCVGPGVVLLFDPYPHASWAHHCWIATVDLEDEQERIQGHHLPPREEEDCRRIPLAVGHASGEVAYL